MKKINNTALVENFMCVSNIIGVAPIINIEMRSTKVISIDAATKSLAVACVNLHNTEQQKLRFIEVAKAIRTTAHLSDSAKELAELLTPITIKSLEVVDLIPNKQVARCGLIERSSALLAFLRELTCRLSADNWLDNNVRLIIEYQMGPNRKSGDIQTQIIYHFLQYLPSENIHIVGPSLKNKLYYAIDPSSRHSFHIAKYTTLYTANKSHTKYIFIKWLTAHGQLSHLCKISKKNYADIADAFCQAAAWHVLHDAE